MRVSGGRLDVRMTELFVDHREALAQRQRSGRIRVADIVDAHVMRSACGFSTTPRRCRARA